MKLLTLLGPTCSGKSQMAVEIAQKLGKKNQKVVIVNCDSRQIYQKLNLGTAKIKGKWENLEWNQSKNHFENNTKKNFKNSMSQTVEKFPLIEISTKKMAKSSLFLQKILESKKAYFWLGIPHFLIDFVPPEANYNLVDFVQDWIFLVDFFEQNLVDLVILTGGTGLWAKAINENYDFGIIKSEFLDIWQKLKKSLEKESLDNLQQKYLEFVVLKIAKSEKELILGKKNKIISQSENQMTNQSLKVAKIPQNSVFPSLTFPKKITKDLEYLTKLFVKKTKDKLIKTQNILNSSLDQIPNKILNKSDFQNPIRLINWLLREKSRTKNWTKKLIYPTFEKSIIFGIDTENENLKTKIKTGIIARINDGLEEEVVELLPQIGREKLWNLGLEYRQTLIFLEEKLNKKDWQNNLIQQNWQYARRQKIWLNQQNLIWVKNLEELLLEFEKTDVLVI